MEERVLSALDRKTCAVPKLHKTAVSPATSATERLVYATKIFAQLSKIPSHNHSSLDLYTLFSLVIRTDTGAPLTTSPAIRISHCRASTACAFSLFFFPPSPSIELFYQHTSSFRLCMRSARYWPPDYLFVCSCVLAGYQTSSYSVRISTIYLRLAI